MLRTLGFSILAAVALGCGGTTPTPPAPPPPPPPPAPIPGDLIVSVNGLGSADGAVMMTVGGAQIDAVAAASGGNRVVSSTAGQSVRLILSGTLANGDLVKITVPDVAKVGSYNVAIDAVADRETFALGDPARYSASIRRP